jgi:hypothetical protein
LTDQGFDGAEISFHFTPPFFRPIVGEEIATVNLG